MRCRRCKYLGNWQDATFAEAELERLGPWALRAGSSATATRTRLVHSWRAGGRDAWTCWSGLSGLRTPPSCSSLRQSGVVLGPCPSPSRAQPDLSSPAPSAGVGRRASHFRRLSRPGHAGQARWPSCRRGVCGVGASCMHTPWAVSCKRRRSRSCSCRNNWPGPPGVRSAQGIRSWGS